MPVAGLVQVGLQARADRYTYVPQIGIFMMAAWGAAALAERQRVRRGMVTAAAVAGVLACTVVARTQAGYWRDSVSLFTRATMQALNVDEYEAHLSLGTSLGNQGRVDEALRHFTDAVRLRPQSDAAHYGLGLALARSRRLDEAAREFAEAVRLNPANQAAHVQRCPARSRSVLTGETVTMAKPSGSKRRPGQRRTPPSTPAARLAGGRAPGWRRYGVAAAAALLLVCGVAAYSDGFDGVQVFDDLG